MNGVDSSRSPRPSPWLSRFSLWVSLLVMCAAICLFHWTVKTSGGFNAPGEEDYYNFLVRGWRSGHLYISKEPSEALKALKDPYDPAQNANLRMGDASYYKGRYYLYFSAAPALLLHWPYFAVTGKELATTTAIFVYCTAGYLSLCALWLALRRRYTSERWWWYSPLVVGIFAVSTHLLILQRRPLVWEMPISAGFAFTMFTFGAIYLALHRRHVILYASLAGVTFGLAIASRPTCVFGCILFAPLVYHFFRQGGTLWLRVIVAIGFPVTCIIGAMLAHNYARFENPLEFGVNYQLSSQKETLEKHFSASYAAHNAYIYLFNPISWEPTFPFARTKAVHGAPKGYLDVWVEPTAGLAVSFLFCYGVFLLPLTWRQAAGTSPLRVLILAIALLTATVVAFYLAFFCATPRYMADFTASIMLLSALGFAGLEAWAEDAKRRLYTSSFVAIVSAQTILTGVALSFDYHNRSLKELQPPIWSRLEKFFSRS